MKKLLALLLMAPAIVFASSDVETEYVYREKGLQCTDWKTAKEVIKGAEEVRVGRGLALVSHKNQPNKEYELQPIVIYVNSKTGTFTILEKTPDGLWCFLNYGENFKLFSTDKIKK